MRPYHATAADRIAQTEARLGRRIQSARDLPDNLSRSLWWKRRRWYFADLAHDLKGGEDDNPYNIAVDERDEAEREHRKLIQDMWDVRVKARQQIADFFARIKADTNIDPRFRAALAGAVS